jgi:hypothetical protein
VSKIDLSSKTVTATANVGSQPASIDLDANGNPVIGGAGFLTTLDKNSIAVLANQQISGNTNAIAVSVGKNQVLTSNLSGSGSGQVTALIARSSPTYSQIFSDPSVNTAPYLQSSISSNLAFPTQLASGIIVSPILNNSFAASATATGFQITNLSSGAVVLSASTPFPVRGMAVDSAAGYFYFTMPDSNSVVTVPIPTTPLTSDVTFLN